MSADKRNAGDVIEDIVYILESERNWSADQLDSIAEVLMSSGYAENDDDGYFAGVDSSRG